MNIAIDSQLSAELQELYLENKEWSSDILFLEDEMRFFQILFDKMLSVQIKSSHCQQVEVISASINNLLVRRKHLKSVLNLRKTKLEQLLEGKIEHIGLELIEEDANIVREIKELLATDKLVKGELFMLIESLQAKVTDVTSLPQMGDKSLPIL